MKALDLKIKSLRNLLDKGEISAFELTNESIDKIKNLNPKLNSFITIAEESALKSAKEADKDIAQKVQGKKLLGIPVAIKDNIITNGIKTTCGSKILSNFIPPYDSTAVEKLKENGAIILGKTNMDEFAMGSSTEHSFFGPARNPWNTRMVPGGSSGGSAISVASREVVAALGSDTGGSVRQPASFCGVVGLKPTYGRVSRYGLVAFASSLDQIGIFTNNVSDCAAISEVIFGYDEKDSTSSCNEVKAFSLELGSEPKKFTLGYAKEHLGEGIDPEVKEAFQKALKDFEKEGFKIEEISLPNSGYAVATYYIVANAEASANLARYDGVRYGYRASGCKTIEEMYRKTRSEGFGQEVKRRIMLGTFVLSSGYYDAYYAKAQKARTLIKTDFDKAFSKVDAILSPTSPTPAFEIGSKVDDPLQMYLCDIYTTSINLAGLPAISIPCGFSKDNLPIGLQIIGKPFDEETLFKLANCYEEKMNWTERQPAI